MQEWFDLASDAEPHYVRVFALGWLVGWLVPYSHLGKMRTAHSFEMFVSSS